METQGFTGRETVNLIMTGIGLFSILVYVREVILIFPNCREEATYRVYIVENSLYISTKNIYYLFGKF